MKIIQLKIDQFLSGVDSEDDPSLGEFISLLKKEEPKIEKVHIVKDSSTGVPHLLIHCGKFVSFERIWKLAEQVGAAVTKKYVDAPHPL